MARKYTRDNRGRFASSGSGATARGGRLRTASGNKRKTQTMKAAGAGGAGVMKGKVARDPGAAGKAGPKAKLDLSGAGMNRRWERADAKREAALNKGDRFQFQRQLAVQRTYMAAKRATKGDASAARDLYASQPKYSTIKNPKSPSKAAKPAPAKPTVYRTRKQAAAAQLDRKRQVSEIGARLPRAGAAQSLSRRAVKVNQGNLLTGRVDKVTANVTTQKGSTRIGESSFAKKTQRRMERVEGRIDALVSARRSLPQRPRRSADQAAATKIDRRLSKMSQAADTYRRARPKARRK